MLDAWTGPLTWDLLIKEIERATEQLYTRQALHGRVRISDAFHLTKQRLARGGTKRPLACSPDLERANETIRTLRARIQRLETENDRLLGQFARWAYNAHGRKLDENFLNQPLPPVNRAQSDRKKNRKIQTVGTTS